MQLRSSLPPDSLYTLGSDRNCSCPNVVWPVQLHPIPARSLARVIVPRWRRLRTTNEPAIRGGAGGATTADRDGLSQSAPHCSGSVSSNETRCVSDRALSSSFHFSTKRKGSIVRDQTCLVGSSIINGTYPGSVACLVAARKFDSCACRRVPLLDRDGLRPGIHEVNLHL
jgi:hypothetical protein